MLVKKSLDDVNIWCSKKKMLRFGKTTSPHTIGTLSRGSLIRHGSVLETVNYYVHTQILLRESCVIQTTVLVNSGDRRAYCPRRSRFRPPINTTLLTSSRLHSHLHPPLARPLSQISDMAPPVCPRADEESPPPEDAHSISSDEDPYAPPDEVAPDPPTLDWFWG